MLLSMDLDYIGEQEIAKFQNDIYEVQRMLKALIKSLENKLPVRASL